MFGATSIRPYIGILGILIIMRLGPADATRGYDCNLKQNKNVASIPFDDLSTDTETLHRSKSFSIDQPDKYAYILMGNPGYMTIVGEDKLYIVNCTPVTVQLQPQDKCYDRLPILKDNQKMFLTPWTLIITNHANEIPCDAPILQDYGLDGIWYKALPEPAKRDSEDQEVIKLKPSTKLTWEYKDPGNLATSGIYTEEEVDRLWEFINNPKMFNPPLSEVTVLPDADGNVPGVIYHNRGTPRWDRNWNTYSILVVVAIAFAAIILVACIVKMVADRINHGSAFHLCRNRQRTRQSDSNRADLTIRLNKTPDV